MATTGEESEDDIDYFIKNGCRIGLLKIADFRQSLLKSHAKLGDNMKIKADDAISLVDLILTERDIDISTLERLKTKEKKNFRKMELKKKKVENLQKKVEKISEEILRCKERQLI